MSAVVEVTRGGLVESRHRLHVAVVEAGKGLVASAGDPSFAAFVRSAAKPFQALPLVEDGVLGPLGWSDRELALCCASHGGERLHVQTADAMLDALGLGEDALACGPHPPLGREAARELVRSGREPGRIHNNCSGKHVGMLALARHHGWPTAGYHEPAHPVQRRMLAEMARWTGLSPEAVETGIDGCGVVCFRVPLEAAATAFARFASAACEGAAAAGVVEAMTREPWLVAGTARLCTDVMAACGGAVFAKTGAEGVYGAAVPGRRLGIALKIEDGARRASDAALMAVLEALDALPASALEALEPHRHPALRNTRGDVVGEVRVRMVLRRSGA